MGQQGLCLAYAPNDKWSFAAGGDMMMAKVGLKNEVHKDLSVMNPLYVDVNVADADLKSDLTPAPGWNAACVRAPRRIRHNPRSRGCL